jgi:hypothetical protein
MTIFKFLFVPLGLLILIACQSEQIGPDPSLLYGTWAQDGVTQVDPTLSVNQAVITYAADGTSQFDAIMTFTANNGIPERFSIRADVAWTLEETVLTRTLTDVSVVPDIPTPEAEQIARALEDAYRGSPPGRLIIEALDDTTLVLLDAATQTTLSYSRQSNALPDSEESEEPG